MSFERLGLAPELLRAVAAQGYVEPTPVQAESIPLVLAGRDVLAGAQTGTGKTAAFVLPILQRLNVTRPQSNRPAASSGRRGGASGLPIRCLILTPTRELALQVEESVRTYGVERPVGSTTIYGGVGFEPQVRALRRGPEIVVATPGRLLDHAGQGTIELGSVEILVLDEADRMLDMGFIRDIRRILALLPARRQNLLFSATFSDEIRELAASFLADPAYVQIARRNAPIELVRQVVYPVDRERKRELLSRLIRGGRIDRALVFTRTKHGANRLAEQLEGDGIAAAAIHGNKSQGQRVRALDGFKSGQVAILVATEIAARGLDIEGLPHVVNFELPMVASDYVHRIGRTGRAGMEGDAISLVCVDEADLLRDIEGVLRQPIRRETVPGFEVDRSIPREAIRQRSSAGRPGLGRSNGSRATASRQMPERPNGGRASAPGPNGPRPNAGAANGSRPNAGPANGSRPNVGQADSGRPGGRGRPAESRPRQGRPMPGRRKERPETGTNGAGIGNWLPRRGAPGQPQSNARPAPGDRRPNGRSASDRAPHGSFADFATMPGERLARAATRDA